MMIDELLLAIEIAEDALADVPTAAVALELAQQVRPQALEYAEEYDCHAAIAQRYAMARPVISGHNEAAQR